jgi:L-seryl-tRNA(Ser) seleniumtransferase
VVFTPAGIVRDVDAALPREGSSPGSARPDRRLVPRTDLLLADPRLAAAERRLGRALVKAAVGRAQQRAREGQITPGEVADQAVAELPA